MKANVLMPLFDDKDSTVVFQAALNELNLINLKIPFKEELNVLLKEAWICTIVKSMKDYLVKCVIFINHLRTDVFQFPDPLNVHISFILNV